MRVAFCVVSCLLLFPLLVFGETVPTFQGREMKIEYYAGSGSKTSYVVIDFAASNEPGPKKSYAFGYRYEVPVDGLMMVESIADAGALSVTSTDYGEWGKFVDNFAYGTDAGTTGNYWRYLTGSYVDGSVTWTNPDIGAAGRTIADGSFDGWFNSFDDQSNPAIPTVPEPSSTLAILGAGTWALLKRKSSASR